MRSKDQAGYAMLLSLLLSVIGFVLFANVGQGVVGSVFAVGLILISCLFRLEYLLYHNGIFKELKK